MALKFDQLPKHVQERIKRDNPSEFRAVETKIAKPVEAVALDGPAQKHKTSSCRMGISVDLVVCSGRLMDDDNLAASCKPLRDAIASSLGIDDGDKRIGWHYHQLKTTGREGVLVRIETSIP